MDNAIPFTTEQMIKNNGVMDQSKLDHKSQNLGHLKVTVNNKDHQKSNGDITKDSGLGATYFATSSGSTSTNTSPDSDKEVAQDGQKVQLAIKPVSIEATSTPSTVVRRHKSKEYKVRLGQKLKQNNDALNLSEFESSTLAFNESTPVALRKYSVNFLKKSCTIGDNLLTALKNPTNRKRQRRMHSCEHCDKQFDRPSLLKRHTLTHTGERPFECKYCSKGFSTRSGVNTHERTHTGQRPYVCRICGRRFAAGSNLIFHKYTHSNTRRHVCSYCPKAFVTPGDLRKHQYTHTGEWPFRCQMCDRGFATERNLKSHQITHTGRKPHTCPLCGKGYAQESSMKTHLRTHQIPSVLSSPQRRENKQQKFIAETIHEIKSYGQLIPAAMKTVVASSTAGPSSSSSRGNSPTSSATYMSAGNMTNVKQIDLVNQLPISQLQQMPACCKTTQSVIANLQSADYSTTISRMIPPILNQFSPQTEAHYTNMQCDFNVSLPEKPETTIKSYNTNNLLLSNYWNENYQTLINYYINAMQQQHQHLQQEHHKPHHNHRQQYQENTSIHQYTRPMHFLPLEGCMHSTAEMNVLTPEFNNYMQSAISQTSSNAARFVEIQKNMRITPSTTHNSISNTALTTNIFSNSDKNYDSCIAVGHSNNSTCPIATSLNDPTEPQPLDYTNKTLSKLEQQDKLR